MVSDELIAAACKATIAWRLDVSPAARLAKRSPSAAAQGVAAALDDGAQWWDALELAAQIGPEELRAAGVDDELVRRIEASRRGRARNLQSEAPSREAEHQPTPAEREAPRPSLRELVAGPAETTDARLLRDHRTLAGHVDELSTEQRRVLAERIAAWWPDRPYEETITRLDRHSWRQEFGPAAWIRYASALDLPIEPERWAEIASSGIVFEPERKWLRAHTSDEGQIRAAEILKNESSPDRWLGLFDCCAAPLTSEVMVCAVEAIAPGEGAAEPPEEDRQALVRVIDRLVQDGQPDLARRAAGSSGTLGATLDRSLAANGDVDAQLRLAGALAASAATRDGISEDDLGWLAGVADEALLAPLFAALAAVWKTDSGPTPRVSSGRGLHDITSPIMAAIAAVGGEAAVNGYDELINRGGDFRWLHGQRDTLVSTLLRVDGILGAASGAAEAAGVPCLAARPEEGAES